MRDVKLLFDNPGHAVVPLVGDDADDGDPRVFHVADADASADDGARIFPIGPGHGLVDHGNQLPVGRIRRREPASARQPRAHGFEGAIRDDLPITFCVVAGCLFEAVDIETVVADGRGERQRSHNGGRFRAGERTHALDQLAVESDDLLGRVVARRRQRQLHR